MEIDVRSFVIVSYGRAAHARQAISELRHAGVGGEAIGLLTRTEHARSEYRTFKELGESHRGRGAAVGAVVGAGGGAIWSLGIAAAALPTIGFVVAGGVLAAAIGSAGGRAGGGGLSGALVGLGFTDEQAAYASDSLRGGRTVLAVSALPSQVERVREIVQRQRSHQRHDSSAPEVCRSA